MSKISHDDLIELRKSATELLSVIKTSNDELAKISSDSAAPYVRMLPKVEKIVATVEAMERFSRSQLN